MRMMSYGIGTKVEIIEVVFQDTWIRPLEKGVIVNRHVSPVGQEVYDVALDTGGIYRFSPSEIAEIEEAP